MIKAKYFINLLRLNLFSFIESVFYVSCMCGTLVREDKDTFFIYIF